MSGLGYQESVRFAASHGEMELALVTADFRAVLGGP